ncbi:MAG: sigma-70 family RNA polymerase sigma factor [Pseudobdellovibrio sp.]
MHEHEKSFRSLIVPHFDSGYNLACWLVKNEMDAADVFQDSCIKALRHITAIQTDNSKGWFLKIVRNTAFTFLKKKDPHVDEIENTPDPALNPEDMLVKSQSENELRSALESLPPLYREVLILREIEEESYESIAEILQIPNGTVMSRLSRARIALKEKLSAKGVKHER